MSIKFGVEFEKAVRLIANELPLSDENSRKPILFHKIRVGVYLYQRGYNDKIVLAGVLHDALEWSKIGESTLEDEFGSEVLSLVKACTMNRDILDKDERISDLISRCVEAGEDALIVKTADIIDSFKWYTKENNAGELEYCKRNAEMILKLKPESLRDKIFDELKEFV